MRVCEASRATILAPLVCNIFSGGSWGGTDRSSQVLVWAEVATGKACHRTESLWGVSFRLGVEGRGEGGTIEEREGGLKKLKDMAPFPISLGDNKKGMLEKGKQREESTKTKARARSV